jgi:hypothetical protein
MDPAIDPNRGFSEVFAPEFDYTYPDLDHLGRLVRAVLRDHYDWEEPVWGQPAQAGEGMLNPAMNPNRGFGEVFAPKFDNTYPDLDNFYDQHYIASEHQDPDAEGEGDNQEYWQHWYVVLWWAAPERFQVCWEEHKVARLAHYHIFSFSCSWDSESSGDETARWDEREEDCYVEIGGLKSPTKEIPIKRPGLFCCVEIMSAETSQQCFSIALAAPAKSTFLGELQRNVGCG